MQSSNMRANNLNKILDKFVSIDGNLYRNDDELNAIHSILCEIEIGQSFQLSRIEKYISPINFKRYEPKHLGEAVVSNIHPFGYLFKIVDSDDKKRIGKNIYISRNEILTKEYELSQCNVRAF